MKKINMITSVSPARQQEIAYWFIGTSILCIALIGYATVQTYYSTHNLKHLQHAKKCIYEKLQPLQEHEKKLAELQKEEVSLRTQLTEIDTHHATVRQIPVYTQTIVQLLTPDCTLESLTIDNQHLTLILKCTEINNALTFTKKLTQEKNFQTCALTNLQRSGSPNTTVQATITGALI